MWLSFKYLREKFLFESKTDSARFSFNFKKVYNKLNLKVYLILFILQFFFTHLVVFKQK